MMHYDELTMARLFGKAIKRARTEKGLTIADLSERTGIGSRYLRGWERGQIWERGPGRLDMGAAERVREALDAPYLGHLFALPREAQNR